MRSSVVFDAGMMRGYDEASRVVQHVVNSPLRRSGVRTAAVCTVAKVPRELNGREEV